MGVRGNFRRQNGNLGGRKEVKDARFLRVEGLEDIKGEDPGIGPAAGQKDTWAQHLAVIRGIEAMGLFPIDLEDEGFFALRIFDGEADASLAVTDPLEDLVALQGEGIGKTLLEGGEGERPFARPRGEFPGAGETHVIAQDPRPFSLAARQVEIIFGHRGDEGEALTGP